MPLCCNWLTLLLAGIAAIESVDRCGRKLWSCPPARPFRQPLPACRPGVLLPEQGPGHHRCPLGFEHAPDAPPGAQTLMLQPTPAVPQLTPQAPLKQQRREQLPMEPPLSQWAVRCRPPRVHIEHTLPTFARDCHVPATPGSRHARLGGRAPQAPAWDRPTPRLPTSGAPLSGGLFSVPAGIAAGHAGLAPRSSKRRAPRPAPHAGRLSSGVPAPGCAAFPWAGVARWRTAPPVLPPRHPRPHCRDGVVRCELLPAGPPHACPAHGHRRGRPRPRRLAPREKA
jgi:hypothetical protein